MNVSEALASRKSVRGFLDKPVEREIIEEILHKAARAPSGGNLQPWHIHVVTGDRIAELKTLMADKVVEMPGGDGLEYDIYPAKLGEPYRSRRFEVGETMYGHIGIPREDKAGRRQWFARNYQFFGAPVGLFCYVDRNMGPPQWSDLGMYLQSVMLLLREAGLDSCPQECWAIYPNTIGAFLGVPEEHMLFTGMAIGWQDDSAPANATVTTRAPLEEFVEFHG